MEFWFPRSRRRRQEYWRTRDFPKECKGAPQRKGRAPERREGERVQDSKLSTSA